MCSISCDERGVFALFGRPISSDRFDIIFADPPYDEMCDDESYISRLLAHDGVVALLKPSGVFVLEKRPTEEVPETKLWRIIRAKTYGSTEVLFLKSNSSRSRQSA